MDNTYERPYSPGVRTPRTIILRGFRRKSKPDIVATVGYRPQSEDTAPRADRVQFDIYRRMTPAEKIERVRTLCRWANQLALVGLRRRHPSETEEQLRRRLTAMRLGGALAERLRDRRDG